MPNIIFNIPLYFTGVTIYIPSIYRTRTQAHGNGFCSSVGRALLQRSSVAASIPSRRPWSCIFRNWSRLGLKMYIFLTLEFTLLYKNIYRKNTFLCLNYHLTYWSSLTIPLIFPAPSSAPRSFTYKTIGPRHVVLAWEPPGASGETILGYKVRRKNNYTNIIDLKCETRNLNHGEMMAIPVNYTFCPSLKNNGCSSE